MNWFFVLIAVAAGLSNPLQSAVNAELSKGLGAPIVAALIVYLIGGVAIFAFAMFYGFPLQSAVRKLGSVPWWAYLGGVFNAMFLIASLVATKRLGSGLFTTLVVVTATLLSVALDHFGALGLATRSATPLRLLGAGFAVVGVVLIARF